MGCCCCKQEDKTSQYGEPNEHSALLGNPVRNNLSESSHGDDLEDHCVQGPLNSKFSKDNQTKVNRILQQTAQEIIDVSTVVPPAPTLLEPRECAERSALYSDQLSKLFTLPVAPARPLLAEVPSADRLLSGPCPLAPVDLALISQISQETVQALGSIRVEHRENLVAHFGES